MKLDKTLLKKRLYPRTQVDRCDGDEDGIGDFTSFFFFFFLGLNVKISLLLDSVVVILFDSSPTTVLKLWY